MHKRLWYWAMSAVALALIATILYGFIPARGAQRSITIEPGMSRKAIAQKLRDERIIRSWVHFWVASVVYGKPLQSGAYTLNPNHNMWELLTALQSGKERAVTLRVPEGWRREQIAARMNELGLDGTRFLDLTKDREGYLFPDTYFIEMDATADEVVQKFTVNFAKRTESLSPTRDQIILASIVEREAKTDAERALIAGIYSNRLKIGMKLDADPTVQYGKETNALEQGRTVEQFWRPITVSDYSNVFSPYNTYLNPGLPPGPIANPGIKSIEAAINPAQTDAYYFLHASDGRIVTGRTVDDHNANKRKYLR